MKCRGLFWAAVVLAAAALAGCHSSEQTVQKPVVPPTSAASKGTGAGSMPAPGMLPGAKDPNAIIGSKLGGH